MKSATREDVQTCEQFNRMLTVSAGLRMHRQRVQNSVQTAPTAHLLVQRVQHALACAVAVSLVWQQHQAHTPPVALESRIEALTLQGVCAGVVVLLRCTTHQTAARQMRRRYNKGVSGGLFCVICVTKSAFLLVMCVW